MTEQLNKRDFELQYAIRVLEMQCRFFRRMDTAAKSIGLLASLGAIGAIGAQSQVLSLIGGVVLAVATVIDFAVRPGAIAASAEQACKAYRSLRAEMRVLDEAVFQARFDAVHAADEVNPLDALKDAAYNRVCAERGHGDAAMIPMGRLQRLIASLA